MDLGLLVLRVAVGLTLAAHGAQKLFGWFGGYGLSGTGGFMEQLGFRPGTRAALMAGLAGTMGGLLLAMGAAPPPPRPPAAGGGVAGRHREGALEQGFLQPHRRLRVSRRAGDRGGQHRDHGAGALLGGRGSRTSRQRRRVGPGIADRGGGRRRGAAREPSS